MPCDDFDWDACARAGLDDRDALILSYFADVEGQTIFYLRELLDTTAARDPEVIAFATAWNYEEYFHAEALARVLEACGWPRPANHNVAVRAGARVRARIEAVVQRAASRLLAGPFPALYMVWGASQELLTLRGYEQLAQTTPNLVLAELCRRIARQERRHFAWYYNQAGERLARSPLARRLTRLAFERAWTPVGVGVKSADEAGELCDALFGRKRFFEVAAEIDARLGRLEGLDGLAAVSGYARRLA